ncbi:hypothetical protein ACFLQN_00850 [Candidatus Aenigmatarchaeota archaeon]
MVHIEMREIDSRTFTYGLLSTWSEQGLDMFAPVAIYPGNGEFQRLQDVYGESAKEAINCWSYHAGPGGIGQYSLKRDRSGLVLAKMIIHFRHPTQDEMHTDIEEFGEQVLREPTEENEHLPIVGGEGIDAGMVFTGPSRIVKTVFAARAVDSGLPQAVGDIVDDIDTRYDTTDSMTVPQAYLLFFADGGRIQHGSFQKPEEYDPTGLTHFGDLEFTGDMPLSRSQRKLTFYPHGNRGHPIDFTEAIVR